jgi:intracellular multiplication protein IcmG
MSKEKDNNHPEDDFSFPEEGEYQFDETHDFESHDSSLDDTEDYGFTSEEAVEPKPAAARKASAAKGKQVAGKKEGGMKKMLMAAGLVFLFLFGAYLFWGNKQNQSSSPLVPLSKMATSTVKTPPKAPAATTNTLPVVTTTTTAVSTTPQNASLIQPSSPTTQVTQPEAATTTTTVSLPSSESSTPQDQSLLQQVTALNTASQTRLAALEGKVSDLTNVMAQLKSEHDKTAEDIKNVQKSITVLSVQTQRLNDALTLLVSAASNASPSTASNASTRAPRATYSTDSSAPRYAPKGSYFVDAVIPGRAWLKGSKGKILTVAVGDPVPGYGVVTSINPQRGWVDTSTGIRFRYEVKNP